MQFFFGRIEARHHNDKWWFSHMPGLSQDAIDHRSVLVRNSHALAGNIKMRHCSLVELERVFMSDAQFVGAMDKEVFAEMIGDGGAEIVFCGGFITAFGLGL